MKLLLTSTGITNKSIQDKLTDLVGKKSSDIHIAFIPTAINVSSVDDKRWMIDNLRRLDDMGVGVIDIVDFTATPQDNWLPHLDRSDVIFVEGGNPDHLMSELNKTGLINLLSGLLKDKVYVGCSDGSTILGKTVIKSSKEDPGYLGAKGIGWVDFSIRPHYKRFDRMQFNDQAIASFVGEFDSVFYAIDDNTAIAVEDGKVEVISEGRWKKFDNES